MKKLGCLLTVILLCCALLCGCGGDDGVFYAAVSGALRTLDPQLASTDTERIVAVNLFEGLFRLGADGKARPAACESHTVSADGLVWTFTLRVGRSSTDGAA